MFEFVEVNTFGRYLYIPDDTLFANLWGLNNTGQTGGTADADIDAAEVWDVADASPDVAVAVLDSGIDYDHEDLECNIWVNPGEDLDFDDVVWDTWDTDDINGVDDDGNGFVDDLIGWDFANGDNNPNPTNSHGTHVSGIIAGCSDNATGIISVAGGVGGATNHDDLRAEPPITTWGSNFGPTPSAVFAPPTGLKSVDLTVTDPFEASAACSADGTVQDTLPPSITPPDAPIAFTVTAEDICDATPGV